MDVATRPQIQLWRFEPPPRPHLATSHVAADWWPAAGLHVKRDAAKQGEISKSLGASINTLARYRSGAALNPLFESIRTSSNRIGEDLSSMSQEC